MLPIGGPCGIVSDRSVVVTPSGRNFPDRTSSNESVTLSNMPSIQLAVCIIVVKFISFHKGLWPHGVRLQVKRRRSYRHRPGISFA